MINNLNKSYVFLGVVGLFLILVVVTGSNSDSAGQSYASALGPSSCRDTDKGVNPATFGYVTGYNREGNRYNYVDSCFNTTIVTERYCGGSVPRSVNMECSNSEKCSRGTCVPKYTQY